MKKIILTLYVLTYERPKYLDECLKSISNQEFTNFNLVILDNGSKANYEHVVREYRSLNITYIKHKKIWELLIIIFLK